MKAMNTLFIHLSSNHQLFGFFYSFSFLISLILLLYEGYRRKFPLLSWVLIISFFEILFIAGTKIFALSQNEWEAIFNNLTMFPTSKKVLTGGLILGGIGLLTSKIYLRFKPNFLDAFDIVLPLVLAIQRLGCYFEGCCHGSPTQVPWAVQYPVNSLPHFHQYQHALIGNNDFFSLPVHPSQLYEFFGGLVVVIMVIKFRKKWKLSGSSFLFSFSLFLIVRLIVEFFRDSLAHVNGIASTEVLSQLQWMIILLLIIFFTILVARESKLIPYKEFIPNSVPSISSILTLNLFSASVIMIFGGLCQQMELFSMLTAFFLSVTITGLHIIRNFRQFRHRLVFPFILLVPFFLMSQTWTENKTDSVKVQKSKSIAFGFGAGSYENSNNFHSGSGVI